MATSGLQTDAAAPAARESLPVPGKVLFRLGAGEAVVWLKITHPQPAEEASNPPDSAAPAEGRNR